MKTLNIYLVCSMAIFLTACGWFDNVDPKPKEGNLATYHWEGTLYKGLGEEVWANASISLEGQHPQGLTYERLTIAQGTTDENGHFRLEYTIDSTDSKYDKYDNGLYEVRFQVGGGYPLMTSPWKVNVSRDLTQTDHSELALKIILDQDLDENDTVFTNAKPIRKHDQIVGLGDNIQGLFGPIESGEYVQFKIGTTSSYDHSSKINLKWGENTIDENQQYFEIRGWPYIDTLELKF